MEHRGYESNQQMRKTEREREREPCSPLAQPFAHSSAAGDDRRTKDAQRLSLIVRSYSRTVIITVDRRRIRRSKSLLDGIHPIDQRCDACRSPLRPVDSIEYAEMNEIDDEWRGGME